MSEQFTGRDDDSMQAEDAATGDGTSGDRTTGRTARGGSARGDAETPIDRGSDRGRTTADDIDESMRARGDEGSGEVY